MIPRALRRALHLSSGVVAGSLACIAIAAGGLSATATPSLPATLLMACILMLVVIAVARRLRFEPPSARAQRVSLWLAAARPLADVEVALSLVAGTYALIEGTGGIDSPAYPLLYGLIAFSMTLQSRAGAGAAVTAAVAIELARAVRGPAEDRAVIAVHVLFLIAAALAHALFLRGLVWQQMRRRDRALAREVAEQRRSAHDYRLISAALGVESRAGRSRRDEEQLLAAGGAYAIGQSIFYMLGMLKRSLDARTVILLWCDERTSELRLKEAVSDSDELVERQRIAATGPLGALLRDRKPLALMHVKPKQLPYYGRGDFAGSFAGVPVLEGPHLRGVLCTDRLDPFDARDLELLEGATEQILRSIQSEQVFLAVERSKYEHERFYQASAMLCRALTLGEVMETAFDAAAQIIDYDAAALTIYDAATRRHRVYSVRERAGGEGLLSSKQLAGLEFRDNSGLVSMVVKNKHYLPAGGEVRDVTAPVYTRRIRLRDAESLVVLPLLSADEAIGTFMLASRRPRQFGKDVREMLGIIANQVAVSLQNGMMYEKMETMATTDGLTGLTNHRTFQERFDDLLLRASRHGSHAALLLCDVDHFKKVNDTYGHPVGDEVLRQVARVLREAVRKIDVPARYGGEEFVVLLEATDLDGARKLAERIRCDVAALMLDSEQGPFQVTMSLGVAVFPDDGKDKAVLIERADSALYHAKESGRNRVVTHRELRAERQQQAS